MPRPNMSTPLANMLGKLQAKTTKEVHVLA